MTLKKVLLSIIGGVTLFTMGQAVHADTYTVPMQVLENGTNSTSYAAAYFANSATVTTNGDQYTVTSTVTTDTSLGNYPVQVLSIDGGGVSTSRSQAGNNQTLTYTFVTSNLAARHNAAIKVDVDSINYHHNYTVGLVLNTAAIPAPAPKTTTSQESQPVSVKQSSQPVSQSVASSNEPTTAITSTSQSTVDTDNSAADTTTETATVSSSSMSTASSMPTTSAHTSTSVAKSTAVKSTTPHKPTTKQATDDASTNDIPVVAIVSGGVAVGILAALALAFFKRP